MKQSLKEIGEILIAIDGGAEWEVKSPILCAVWYQPAISDPILYLHRNDEIRLKPRTVRIGEYDVPEPLRVEPERGEYYHIASPDSEDYTYDNIWYKDDYDMALLRRGLIHATAEAAALHGKVLASLTSKEPIE